MERQELISKIIAISEDDQWCTWYETDAYEITLHGKKLYWSPGGFCETLAFFLTETLSERCIENDNKIEIDEDDSDWLIVANQIVNGEAKHIIVDNNGKILGEARESETEDEE